MHTLTFPDLLGCMFGLEFCMDFGGPMAFFCFCFLHGFLLKIHTRLPLKIRALNVC